MLYVHISLPAKKTALTGVTCTSSSSSSESSSASSWQECKANLKEGRPATSDREKWLQGFYDHLRHMDSGLLKEKDSTQNVNEMRKIIEAGEKEGSDIDCLVSFDGKNIWRDRIQPALDKLKSKQETDKKNGGTIQAYFVPWFHKYFQGQEAQAGTKVDKSQAVSGLRVPSEEVAADCPQAHSRRGVDEGPAGDRHYCHPHRHSTNEDVTTGHAGDSGASPGKTPLE